MFFFLPLFLRHHESKILLTLHDYNLVWGLHYHFRFDEQDLVSRSLVINVNCKLSVLDSCPLLLKCCMVVTCIEKIAHNMICVTGMYSKEIIKMFLSVSVRTCQNFKVGIFSDAVNVITETLQDASFTC